MSKTAVTEMLSRADQDATMLATLNAALESSEGDGEAFMATAASLGYAFTPDEFREVLAECGAPGTELSDAALDTVAGGLIGTNGIIIQNVDVRDFGSKVDSLLTKESSYKPPLTS